MDLDKPPAAPASSEGCLAVAIRLPVRIVVLVLVVPVRLVWDALTVAGRFLRDTVLRPLGRALLWLGGALFVWPWVALWRWVVVPVGKGIGFLGHVLLVVPARWLYARVLAPLGRGTAWLAGAVGAALVWLGHHLFVVPARWLCTWLLAPVGRAVARCARAVATGVGVALYWTARVLFVLPALWLWTWVLVPAGHGVSWLADLVVTGVAAVLYWTARVLLVLPARWLWRRVLAPVGRVLAVLGREIADALGHAWRIAGRVSLVVGRALGTLFRWIFVEPVRWAYRTVLTPVGHVVRDHVLRPAAQVARAVGHASRQALATARDTVRQARADLRRMLLGDPRQPVAVDRREPHERGTRTLGSSTTALTKD
ncbi:hypothetical protein [Streptomyces sp. NPDC004100]